MIGQDQFLKECMDIMPIVYRLNRSFNRSVDLDAFHTIPPAQLHALIMLWNGGTLNMTQLADQMLMPRQQLTRVVDALVDKGMVDRGTDECNRRLVLISLSDKGRGYVEQKLYCEPNGLTRFLSLLEETDVERLLDAMVTIKEVLLAASQKQNGAE